MKCLYAAIGALAVVAMTAVPAHAEWRHPANRVVVLPDHHVWNHHGWNGPGVVPWSTWGSLVAPPYYPPVYATPPVVYAPYGYWRGY